jgi:hypothetical protein
MQKLMQDKRILIGAGVAVVVILLIGVVVLVAGKGGSAATSQSLGEKGTGKPDGYKEYSNSLYTWAYPTDWTLMNYKDESSLRNKDFKKPEQVTVRPYKYVTNFGNAINNGSCDDAGLRKDQGDGSPTTTIDKAYALTINGQKACLFEKTSKTDTRNPKSKSYVILSKDGKSGYSILISYNDKADLATMEKAAMTFVAK